MVLARPPAFDPYVEETIMNRPTLAHGTRAPIPITIVGGPVGAGKTTLLRRLLGCNDGRHIAVVVDHPSALRIDGAFIAKADGNSLLLRNGCVCLGLDGEIATALSWVQSQPGLTDHVVIEASSDASLLRMSGYAYMPGFRPGGNVLVLSAPDIADAQTSNTTANEPLADQLRHAELLVLNHVDRISPPLRRNAQRWLQQYASQARIVESERCCIPSAMLLGVGLRHAPAHAMLGEWTPDYAVDGGRRRSRITQPRHGDDYRAWVLTTRNPIESRSFRRWVSALPDSVLRGDGVVRLQSEPRHRFQFRLCGARWSLSPDGSAGDGAPASWISLVGLASTSLSAPAADGDITGLTARGDTESPPLHRRRRGLTLQQPQEVS
jgi:G3E family GTPase